MTHIQSLLRSLVEVRIVSKICWQNEWDDPIPVILSMKFLSSIMLYHHLKRLSRASCVAHQIPRM